MGYAVEAEGLVKHYRMGLPWRLRVVRALDGVSLRIREGSLYSLLGPNGAGKTTLVKILSTLLIPDGGWARVSGFDVVSEARRVRERIGVVLGGERALYWRLSAWDNLWFFSQLYGLPAGEARRRIRELLDLVGLSEWAHVRVENYSKGMKQRLHIARGLLNDPEVLLLDEPTIGLDPAAARELRALIRRIVREEGRTVLLTTHYLPEAEELSDRIAIIDRGRIIAEGSPEEVRRLVGGPSIVEVELAGGRGGLGQAIALGSDGSWRVEVSHAGDGMLLVRARVGDVDGFLRALLGEASRRGYRVRSIQVHGPSLEDVFLRLTRCGGETGA
ncbi:MAG: ABC transporter ATP-binding protein [Desulfurococcales archaeon]|nr:ABC transporter ATP-binding protein [Desulfurococcales archaeon]